MRTSPNFWIVTNHDYVRYTRLEHAIAEKDRLYALHGGRRRFQVIRCKGVTSSPASRREAELLLALEAARAIIAEDAAAVLDTAALRDDMLRPVRASLDPDARADLEQLEAVLARIDAALDFAGEIPLTPAEVADQLGGAATANVAATAGRQPEEVA